MPGQPNIRTKPDAVQQRSLTSSAPRSWELGARGPGLVWCREGAPGGAGVVLGARGPGLV